VALSSTIRTLRSRDITDSIPFNVGQPSYVSDIWTNTTVAYDVAIGGLPFFYGINNDRPYERQTAPYKKQQFDNSKEPGEQTLEGWWIRSQSSFHRGAGITFFDPSAGEEVDYRFSDSEGVDVWTKGQASLLKKVTAGHATTTSSQKMRSIKYSNTNAVLALDGHDVDKLLADGTVVHFIDYNSGTDDPVYAICDDGTTAYWATNDIDTVNKAHLFKKVLTADSTTAETLMFNINGYTFTDGKVVMEWVKGRIILCTDNKVCELTPTSGVGAYNNPIFTHPTTNYTFTSVTESGSSIYVAGYSGIQSAIYKFSLSTAGAITSLTSAVIAAEMPIGEIIHSIKYYLGYMLIGTSKGVRVAQVSVDDGSIAYGPLVVETEQPVYDFDFRDRFVWFTSKVNGKSGLTRLDLGEQITPLKFAYAHDVFAPDSTGTTTACAFIGDSDQIAFSVPSNFFYVQSATEYVTSGYLQTGYIRYGTLEPKNFKRVRARGDYSNGGLLIAPVGSDGTVYETAIYNSTIGAPEINIINPPGSQEFIGMRFTLSRYEDPTDTASTLDTTGPTFKGYQVRALPATPRQHLIQLPLYCYDVETDRYNVQVGYDGRSWERIQLLEDLESTGDEVIFQDFTTGEQITVVIDSVGFQRATPPSGGFSGFGGNLTVIVREVG
jgi:hypothetical protein